MISELRRLKQWTCFLALTTHLSSAITHKWKCNKCENLQTRHTAHIGMREYYRSWHVVRGSNDPLLDDSYWEMTMAGDASKDGLREGTFNEGW